MKCRNIHELLPNLRKRPSMYIGSESVFDLSKFLNGYEFALYIHDIQDGGLFDEDLSFHDWVALRTHFYESTSGWANMLSERYGEDNALEHFWKHYDEYGNRKLKIIKVAFPKQNKPWKYRADPANLEPVSCYIRPYQVQKIKYTDDPGFFIRFLNIQGEEIDRKRYCLTEEASIIHLGSLNLNESDWKENA